MLLRRFGVLGVMFSLISSDGPWRNKWMYMVERWKERMEGRKETAGGLAAAAASVETGSLLPLHPCFFLLLKCLTQHHETLYNPPHFLFSPYRLVLRLSTWSGFCPWVWEAGWTHVTLCRTRTPASWGSALSNIPRQASKGMRWGSTVEL